MIFCCCIFFIFFLFLFFFFFFFFGGGGGGSFLQVTRTTIKIGMSSNLNQIRLLTEELAALERLENPY